MTVLREEIDKTKFTQYLLPTGITKKRFLEITITIIIASSLLIFSCYIKELMAAKINSKVHYAFYYTFVNSQGQQITWYLEGYGDGMPYHNYSHPTFYYSFLKAFTYDRWDPYARYEGLLDGYMYGPLFIYSKWLTLVIIRLFNPSLSQNELINLSLKWSAIVIDSLCVVVIYLIIIKLKTLSYSKIVAHTVGIIASIGYIFVPANLYYVDYLNLNGELMTFFTLLALLFILQEKYTNAAIIFAFAWLSKQMPLFLIVAFFLLIWKKNNDIKYSIKHFLNPFLLTSFILSIPWIFMHPILYLGRIFAAGRPELVLSNNPLDNSVALTLANSILYSGCDICAKIYWWINFPMIPFLLFYGGSLLIAHFNAKRIMSSEKNIIVYTTWSTLTVFSFISRGIYKYYDIYLNPFLFLSAVIFSVELIKKLKKLVEKRKNIKSKVTPNKFLEVAYHLLGLIFLALFIGLIYYTNFIIMIAVRYIHPFLILLVFLLYSILVPRQYYSSLKIKANYVELKTDIKDYFALVKANFKKLFSYIRSRVRVIFHR